MRKFLLLLVSVLVASSAGATDLWKSFISAAELHFVSHEPNLLVIDVRAAKDYALGHIPGSINIPGDNWRTPLAKPSEGDSQYLFYKADGSPDVERYEALLSAAGVKNTDRIVIYGNHAGKADGSVPAFILRWLGHDQTAFLDGVGIHEWQEVNGTVSTEVTVRPPSVFKANADNSLLWDLEKVKANVGKPEVVFFDTRGEAEFDGTELRDNKRGGHIPGAVLINYEDLLDSTKRVLSPAEMQKRFEAQGITKDKTVVLYCQTATRVTLAALALFDLGYENVAVYDASWHEYGNRDDTEVSRTK